MIPFVRGRPENRPSGRLGPGRLRARSFLPSLLVPGQCPCAGSAFGAGGAASGMASRCVPKPPRSSRENWLRAFLSFPGS